MNEVEIAIPVKEEILLQLDEALAELKALLPAAQVEYVAKQPSLEDIFLQLTTQESQAPAAPARPSISAFI